jgi:hypothetical protein
MLKKEVSRVSVELIEIAGFPAFLESLRIPFKKEVRSDYTNTMQYGIIHGKERFNTETCVTLDEKDLKLACTLKNRGDEHAKSVRMITVDCIIDGPLWFWQEMVTYEVGVTKGCSESTMHVECKGMSGSELEDYKDNIPSGHKQKRVFKFSYQTLRRLYLQRKNHRLDSWQAMIQFIEALPYAKDLILFDEEEVKQN